MLMVQRKMYLFKLMTLHNKNRTIRSTVSFPHSQNQKNLRLSDQLLGCSVLRKNKGEYRTKI